MVKFKVGCGRATQHNTRLVLVIVAVVVVFVVVVVVVFLDDSVIAAK